ncbi:MAG: mechanosensitive ion channel family protein [Moraxellaceae bacterium]|nr:mechanosensitive ion channel family protein [Moraxellaceae bacterium]
MPDSIAQLGQHLQAVWHAEYLNVLVASAILVMILLHKLDEGRQLLRSALLFVALIALLVVTGLLTSMADMTNTASILDSIAVLLAGVLLIRLCGLVLFRVAMPAAGLQPPRILEDILIVIGYIGWGMVQLRYAGLNLTSLVTTSAVLTAIIAFAMQDTLGNILGGLSLQLDKSVSIGDWIKVDDVSGRVIEVHWRHTAVRTRNGEIVVLPNSLLMKGKFTIVGGDGVPQWRRWVHFRVSNTIPPQRVIDAVERALGLCHIPLMSNDPAPSCVAMEFGEGQIHYAVRYWLRDPLVDDPTDSAVRVHVYAALQRQGYTLGSPVLAVNLTTESSERDAKKRDAELALRQRTLKKIEMFRALSDEELAQLASGLTYAPFARGDVITRQGDIAHWLYILISGEADIWYEASGQDRRHLTTLPSGHIFGEMGLMTGEPRRATVTARTDAECYRLEKSAFERIIHSRPELAEEFAHMLTERNQQLVVVQQGTSAQSPAQQKAQLLANIRKFFRLDNGH